MIINHFYSDPHWGHTNIIKYSSRPFSNIAEMDAELIRRYNECVQPHEVVLWCGDCTYYSPSKFAGILEQLNGSKLLVRGNHDKPASTMAQIGFDFVVDELTIYIGGRTCTVNHFPYAGTEHHRGGKDDRYLDRRPKRRKGEVIIHGHTHSPKRRDGNMIHVGIDAWDYRPASMVEVEALVAAV
jgi:calcineurin-like phosphoesterase family protein